MSHAITIRTNGFAEMAYTGEKPWHNLGQELPEGQSIEQWQVSAGMDWSVQRSKVRYAIDREATQFSTVDDRHVLMRSDTKAALGIVSDQFKIVHPKDVLEFFRSLVEANGAKMSTAGTLHGGVKFWAMASLDLQEAVVGKDLLRANLLMATACDGSMRTIVKNVSERVVCANTLAYALGEKGARQVQLSHRSVFDADEVKVEMGLGDIRGDFHRFIAEARELTHVEVSRGDAQEFVAKLLGETLAADEKPSRGYTKILELFNGAGMGSTMPGVQGTAWGLVNAVTEYVDYHIRASNPGNRFDSAQFGVNERMKWDAMSQAKELMVA